MNKRKFNSNAGVTLATLIIIVAVLAIIASVTIGTVKENKIISHSKTAIKQFSELEFREKLEVIFLSYTTANQRGLKINNKKIANKILNLFDYPNINTETGDLLDGEEGTTDFYTMTAEDGMVNVKNNATAETILGVTYDKENKPKFMIEYKGVTYEYDNYKLAKVDYYVNGNPEEWTWTELEDGTIKITAYKGNGKLDPKNPGVYDLTIPNRINGMNVSQIDAETGFDNINGTLTISSLGLTITSLEAPNVKKIILKDDILVGCVLGGSNTTDFIVGSRCIIEHGNVNWVNVEVGEDVTFGKSGVRCFDGGTVKLSKQSISNILGTTLISETWYTTFYKCNFINSPDIVVPENSNINAINFRDCTNIKSITIKKGSTIATQNWQRSVFHLGKSQIERIVIEDNCSINNLMYIGSDGITAAITVNEIEIGNNVKLSGRSLVGINGVQSMSVGDNLSISGFIQINGINSLKIGNGFSCVTIAGGNIRGDSLTSIEFGDNAEMSTGGNCLANVMQQLESVKFGDNSNLKDNGTGKLAGTLDGSKTISTVELGKGTQIGALTFRNCTDLQTITLYLTDEQKADNTKIPRNWQKNVANATFTETIDDEKVVWNVSYTTT